MIPPLEFHLILVFTNERKLVPDHFFQHVSIRLQTGKESCKYLKLPKVPHEMNKQYLGLHIVNIHSQALPMKNNFKGIALTKL